VLAHDPKCHNQAGQTLIANDNAIREAA
jgi:hypothetical protein